MSRDSLTENVFQYQAHVDSFDLDDQQQDTDIQSVNRFKTNKISKGIDLIMTSYDFDFNLKSMQFTEHIDAHGQVQFDTQFSYM